MPALETWYCGFVIIHVIPNFMDFVGKDEEQILMFNNEDIFFMLVCRLWQTLKSNTHGNTIFLQSM